MALVTGAARGIGREICLKLAEIGFDIAGVDILMDHPDENSGLLKVRKDVEGFGRRLLPIQADISDLESHQGILDSTLGIYDRIDVLVNNAGVAPEIRLDILETTPESYDRVFSINTRGAFFLSQKIVSHMIALVGEGVEWNPSVIFVTSISAYVSSPSRAEYCMSKAALSMAAKLFADRLAGYGINVYEVRPGIIETDMTAPVKEKYDKLIGGGLIPQGRWGLPKDVAKVVASLARGDFAYSTGLAVEVSGGMNIQRL